MCLAIDRGWVSLVRCLVCRRVFSLSLSLEGAIIISAIDGKLDGAQELTTHAFASIRDLF